MTPYEIMLSESQERMLAIIEKGHEDEVAAVFHKWGLNAVVVGEVTDTGRVVLTDEGVVVADIPAKALTDDCPTYSLDASEPALQELARTTLVTEGGDDQSHREHEYGRADEYDEQDHAGGHSTYPYGRYTLV